jgi:hypothetical protein
LPGKLAVALACGLAVPMCWAGGIYTCIDSKGRRLTADRPIPECTGKEQQVLNHDGSVRNVVPPTLTAEERLAVEARERAAAEARLAQLDAVRRDRNLMARYPNEAAHQRARASALDTVRLAIKSTENRLRDLAQQRKPLLNEAEFYQGKALPPKLKAAMDANDAAMEAQKSSAATQEAELGRINKLYDAELERLRRLWAGAAPGRLGTLSASTGTAPALASPAASAVPASPLRQVR